MGNCVKSFGEVEKEDVYICSWLFTEEAHELSLTGEPCFGIHASL